MKRLLWAAVACLTPAAAWSADYTVTSNLPSKYTVTSNLPPKAPAAPAAKKRVRYAGYWWDEFPDGRLLWCTECNGPYPAAGVPGVVVVDWNGGKPPAPGVAAPQPFRSGTAVNNAGHNCPACGAAQYRVSGAGPVAGSHTHTCDRCGQSWWH